MLIKSIKLHNIRSYLDEKIEFPEGSTMLSGDIGSGKSTILLAAEFGLFGIMKGEVSGESLLRHGKKEGSIELLINIDGKDILINRALRRGKNSVKQEAGSIIMNMIKKEGTATELKSFLLGILGYPKDLLTKSKGLIYRYTVYTPQEEMKKILFEDQEARLNTLRRVFDVDKYKRIRENAKIYISELRGKIKEIEGGTSDLDEKRSQLEQIEKEIKDVKEKLSILLPNLENAKKDFSDSKQILDRYESEVKKLIDLKRELALCDAKLKSSIEKRQRNAEDIQKFSEQAEQLKKEVEGKDSADVSEKIIENEKSINQIHDTILRISKSIAEASYKIKLSKETKSKVSEIDNCPMCLQDVSHEHKQSIIKREDEKISKYDEEVDILSVQEKKANQDMQKLKKDLEELRKKEKAAEAVKFKLKELKLKMDHIENLKKEQEKIKQEIGKINMEKIDFSKEIESLKRSEEKYNSARDILEKKRDCYHKIEIQKNTLETDMKNRLSFSERLEAEIKRKEESKAKLSRLRNIQHWLDNNFTCLMEIMEKQVMAKVYHSFNELFQSWFNILMEDETINARLDDSFTPVIQQNGFDTSMSFLSGGEKTSCALAYRLALNKVINDLISAIKTKDIIILDEPTDGFSSEQLDRVREVIEQLDMKQVIIVSHEQKIEGFVDKVIRIQKNEHVSSIA